MKKKPFVLIGTIVGVFLLCYLLSYAGMRYFWGSGNKEKSQKGLFSKNLHIGVLEITGVILDSKKTLARIESFEEDETIRGVIVRINSPGGAVAPSQEIYHALKRLSSKKPVYSSFSSLAASGGYYVACGTQKIFANEGTITGSIGVIMQFADLSKLFQWAKYSPYNIKTGKFKDIGSPERAMRSDERDLLQGMIDNVLAQFRHAVSDARHLPYDKVVELSDGRIFSGEQAKALKLVDSIGGLRETAEAMVVALKGEGKPVLVYPSKKRHYFIEKLFEDDSDEDAEMDGQIAHGKTTLTKLLQTVLSAANGIALEPSSTTQGPMFLFQGR